MDVSTKLTVYSSIKWAGQTVFLLDNTAFQPVILELLELQNDRRNQKYYENQNGESLSLPLPLRKRKASQRRKTQKGDPRWKRYFEGGIW